MKIHHLLFFVLAFSPSVLFAEIQEPPKFCYEDLNNCSEQQKQIFTAFQSGTQLPQSSIQANVYSGYCYHSGRGYDNTHPHVGVAMLSSIEGQSYFHGRFGFWYEENPYANWPLEKAQKELSPKYDAAHQTITGNNYLFVNLNPGGQYPVLYWLRHSKEGPDILLAGFWGAGHHIACHFQPNP